jgi:hypothetical protein
MNPAEVGSPSTCWGITMKISRTGYRSVQLAMLMAIGFAAAAQAANLQLIVFADTIDPTIGTDKDLIAAQNWGQAIAANTGLTLRFQSLSGHSLTPAMARTTLRNLDPGSDDVVYFVYSGHGANAGDSVWPTFTLLTYTGDPDVDFDEVVSILQPKAQRLLIVLADCCNVPYYSGREVAVFAPAVKGPYTVENFRRLFLEFAGMIRASASSVGQYSLGDSAEGGLFLNTYMDTFQDLASDTPSLTWQQVLTQTAANTKAAAALYMEAQEPHFVIDAEQVAAAEPTTPTGDTSGTTGDTPGDPTGDTGSTTGGDVYEETALFAPACGQMSLVSLSGLAGGLLLVRRRRAA